jgi:hypothetical protein
MSYLRGPLTREEVARLMREGKGPAEAAPAAKPSPPPVAPVLPAPLKSQYYPRYGGEVADPYLLVKYAVRYRDAAETVAARAWPLAAPSPAEIFEAEATSVEEDRIAADAPGGLRHGELPGFVSAGGAKALEKAIKERLPDKLAVKVFFDPLTKAWSSPQETAEAFAARLSSKGGGGAAEKLRDRIEKKGRDLALKQQELAGRKQAKWLALGSAVLKNIALFTGRKRTVSGLETALSKNRMEDNAAARVEGLQAELAELQRELEALTAVDPGRLEARDLLPSRTDVKVLRYDVLWIY